MVYFYPMSFGDISAPNYCDQMPDNPGASRRAYVVIQGCFDVTDPRGIRIGLSGLGFSEDELFP